MNPESDPITTRSPARRGLRRWCVLVSMAAGLFVWPGEGPVLANYGLDHLRFASPVYVGDVLQVQFTCKQKVNRETEDYGEVRWDTTIVNQDAQVVANYDVLTLVKK